MTRMMTRPLLVCGLTVLVSGCATGQDPCDPNPCVAPPPDNCVAGVARIFPATGQCLSQGDQAECTYEPALVDCINTGQFCLDGQCLSDPCDPNPCVSAPTAGCDVNVLVTYDETGFCETTEGNVECTYSEASRTDCAVTGEICENGACVVSLEPCNPNPCTNPPGNSCAGEVASIYPAVGNCTDNAGTADCDYVPVVLDCSDNALLCDAGQCVPDPCSPNPCTNPPADTCTGDTANVHPATGACVNAGGTPNCTYTPSPVSCTASGLICANGLCVTPGDPCNPNPCTNVPANDCLGNTARTFSGPGTCTDSGGSPVCNYPPVTQDCTLTGEVCSGGNCIVPGSGGVIISEYVEGSSFNKYLELYNAGSSAVDLSTFTVEVYFNGSLSVSATLTLDPVVLLPGAVFVVADDGHTLWTNPGPDQVVSANLWNGNDAIRLVNGTTQVDVMGIIGDAVDWGKDVTLVRNAGVIVGITAGSAWNPAEWTSLPIDTHQLGGHTP